MSVGEVRTTQLITTYGVGAIVAAEDETFMVCGLDRWTPGPEIAEPRLQKELGVNELRRPRSSPPETKHPRDVPVVRFPRWASCPYCKNLDTWDRLAGYFKHTCRKCDQQLVASRFVMVCERGHIDDFPYASWVHEGKIPRGGEHRLELHGDTSTASLAAIVIRCSCGAEASMQGAFQRGALAGISACTGERPWLSDRVGCSEQPRVLQRGASNVWFAVNASAISIPPWSEHVFKAVERIWPSLRGMIETYNDANDELKPNFRGFLESTIRAIPLPGLDSEFSVEDVIGAGLARLGVEQGTEARSLREEEHEALIRGNASSADFVCVPLADEYTAPDGATCTFFDRVMLAKRLREVRVLTGFTRVLPLSPGDDRDTRLAPLVKEEERFWLPGVEVIGEGIFLELSTDRLRDWEQQAEVVKRAGEINHCYADQFATRQQQPDREITARLILIHSLAHALITQWALDCGYPAAALRERLYVSDEMAGLLIYTATSDSAGSLGGIVGLAEDGDLDGLIAEAIREASWCSSDPICIERTASGVDGLNKAACHACLLLPEVSCEEMNVLLDRAMLIGTAEHPELGFFSDLMV
jgi:MrfA Zn-binding domain